MANLSGFNANDVEPNGSPPPIPAGEYEAIICESAYKPTADGGGKYLKLVLQVLNGPFQNRKLYENLNLENANERAVQIAKGTLSAICRAVGVLTPQDSSELHDKPLVVKVTIKQDANYGDQNKIKAYRKRETPMSGGTGGQPAFTPQQSRGGVPAGAGVGGAAAPWAPR